MLVCRDGQENLSQTHRDGEMGPYATNWLKNIGISIINIVSMSPKPRSQEFIMPPYLSVAPLKGGNYIYKILRQ